MAEIDPFGWLPHSDVLHFLTMNDAHRTLLGLLLLGTKDPT